MTLYGLLKLLKAVPWRFWALLAFLLAIVGAQLYLRHKWVNEGRAEYRDKLEQCQAVAGELSAAVKAQNAENAKRIAEAGEQKARADKAVAQANAAAERLVQRLGDFNRQMEAARRDPACREQLEQRACVALR